MVRAVNFVIRTAVVLESFLTNVVMIVFTASVQKDVGDYFRLALYHQSVVHFGLISNAVPEFEITDARLYVRRSSGGCVSAATARRERQEMHGIAQPPVVGSD